MALPTQKCDPLLRILFVNGITGAYFGTAFAALLLIADVARLRTLIISAEVAFLELTLLFGGFGTLFAVVSATSAILLMHDNDSDTHGHLVAGQPTH